MGEYLEIVLILGGLLGIICFTYAIDYLIRRQKIQPIIAGDVNSFRNYPDKYLYRLNNFKIGNKTVKSSDFDLVGYLKGNSLDQFGLYDGNVIFCEYIAENPRKNDILILKITTGSNKGKLKARKYLGYWGKENEPDEDVKKYANFHGTIAEYFKKEIAKRDEVKPYTEQIEGYLKTVTSGQNVEDIKISRPHNPRSIEAVVKYVM